MYNCKTENRIATITVPDTDTQIPKANGITNGLMDAKRSANSAKTVTTLTNTTSVRSCLKTVPKLTRTENATNVKTVTISIGMINV